MADQTALLRAFADFARTIAGPYEIGDVLYRLTDHTVAVLEIDGAGVSLSDAGELNRSSDVVTSADQSAEGRWPKYTPSRSSRGSGPSPGSP